MIFNNKVTIFASFLLFVYFFKNTFPVIGPSQSLSSNWCPITHARTFASPRPLIDQLFSLHFTSLHFTSLFWVGWQSAHRLLLLSLSVHCAAVPRCYTHTHRGVLGRHLCVRRVAATQEQEEEEEKKEEEECCVCMCVCSALFRLLLCGKQSIIRVSDLSEKLCVCVYVSPARAHIHTHEPNE